MKSEVLAWVPRRQELVHHTPQDQSSTPGHPGAVVTSTSTSYFKFTLIGKAPATIKLSHVARREIRFRNEVGVDVTAKL